MNPEVKLIKSIQEGNEKAFNELYNLQGSKVLNTALSFVQNYHDAEEITQEVFVKIYRYIGKFKFESSLSTWIYRITVNTSLTYLKKKQKNAFSSLGESEYQLSDFEHPGVILEKKEASTELYKVINTLPSNQKTAFILSFIEDLPRQEVATIMETTLKAVESLLQRAKKNLRDKLKIEFERRKTNKS